MNYCSDCGSAVSRQTVAGDNVQRYVCDSCGKTHYQSPIILVATYVCVGNSVLWIRRGTAPAVGKWAMPGGYVECDETPQTAASRELREETGVVVEPEDMIPVSVNSILHISQTHLVFRCHLEEKPETITTEEATECCWFSIDELPWSELAFPTIEPHVRQLYRWLDSGNFGLRLGFINEQGSDYQVFPLARSG